MAGTYGDSLSRAAEAMALGAREDKKRGKENSPWKIAEFVGDVIDIPLTLTGNAPIAGSIGDTISGLGQGDLGKAGEAGIEAAKNYSSWRDKRNNEKAENARIDEFIKMFKV